MLGLYESGYTHLTSGNIAMLLIGAGLIYLGIARKMEPLLLVPIGFGIFMVNLPIAGIMVYTPEGLPALGGLKEIAEGKIGILNLLYYYGLNTELIPLLIFLGVGTLMDFRPTIARPISLIFGATAQLGVFVVFLIAYLSGVFTIKEAACIGIIGGSDGPPTVYLTVVLAPVLLGPITMVAYSYMALVPILQPPVIRLLTTKKERRIMMKPQIRKVSQLELILFPIVVFIVATILVPKCAPLVGMLMFGNLLRVSGVTDRLANAGSILNDILILLLGICVGGLMPAQVFFNPRTLVIIGLAVLAFIFSTAGGLLTAKLINLFLKEKINPIIGAAGVSAIPMAARVAQAEGQKANKKNYLLMHALGPNMAGAIGTALVAGIFMGMLQ
ncbi:MAG: sodium ion-translocating decarboxylase subunit beta [Deltaproteobacteria bacterium]|nr:sodium ion-translocating decarboxylase subunit beta [Deltaproteobacteria bacterium]